MPDVCTRSLIDRYFEDYPVGLDVTLGSERVMEDDILTFAHDFDTQYIHQDPQATFGGPFGGLIASGWHTCALMMRVFSREFLNDRASLASPGTDELRWPAPVRPGGVLAFRFQVTEARVSRSRPDRGIIITRVTGTNQRGEIVLTLTATNFLLRRPPIARQQ